MISRRIIRIKVMQTLYAFHLSPDQTIKQAENELFYSIGKTYDLYHWMLQLLVDIRKYAEERIELKKQKKMPTADDLDPNTKFINNIILDKLSENTNLEKYTESKKLNWNLQPTLIKKIYEQLISSESYKKYMMNSDNVLSEDRKLLEFFIADIVAESDDVHQLLEEKSVYWNDDLEFVLSMIIRTIGKFNLSTSEGRHLMPLFKDEDDEEFAKKLLRKAIIDKDEHRKIIEEHLRNWDIDRVAFMDVVIMELAITEFINFPSVPTKVSLNEYIDLAKFFSTSKSRTFINGILDKTLKTLKEEGKIKKAGRGLIGEN